MYDSMNKKFGLLIIGILIVMSSCMPIIGVALTSEDRQFLEWLSDTAKTLELDRGYILDAIDEVDLDGMATYSKWLHDDANEALSQIDQYHVSSALKPVKNEFKLALQDDKLAGYYFHEGGKNSNFSDIEKATEYLKSALRHMKKVNALLSRIS